MNEVTKKQMELIQLMKDVGLAKITAMKIMSVLVTEQQQIQMINYIKKWEKIITDHQAIQEAVEIIERKEIGR